MEQKGFANILLVIVILAIVAVGGYFVFVKKSTPPTNISSQNQVVNNEILNKPFISPSQKTIDSDKEVEFTFSAPKEAIQSRVYLSCESGMVAYFSDNTTPRTPTPYPNICNTWQENGWDTVQPDPKFVRDIRDIKFRNDSTQGKIATLQMTVTMPDNSSIQSNLASITVNPKLIASPNETADWNIFTDTQYGFEFKYPATWKATVNDNEGADYKVIARVVNPSRAGKPDTDVPIEQFLVRSQNITCEGQSINLGGKTGTGRGWEQGFGLIYYRDLCFKTQGWATTISLSAFDESSQAVMDKLLSTFRFTK